MPERRPGPTPTHDAPSCRACGYALAGLRVPGVCPECGTGFPPYGRRAARPRSAWAICVLMTWPLGAMGVGLFFAWSAEWSPLMPLRSSGLMIFALSGVALLVNTPVQAVRLAIEHAAPGRRLGNPLRHLPAHTALLVAAVALAPFMLAVAGMLVPLGRALLKHFRQ